MRCSLRDIHTISRVLIGSNYVTYPVLRYARGKKNFLPNKYKMVNSNTQMCVDGFPHSGNTFFTRLISHWNQNLILARHLHVPYQIVSAIKKCIPTFVLIRHPLGALTSILHRYPDLHFKTACWHYYYFYSSLINWKNKLIIVEFEKMIKDPVPFFINANEKFGCDLFFESYSREVEESIIHKIPGKAEKIKNSEVLSERKEISQKLENLKVFDRTMSVYTNFLGKNSFDK